MFQTPSRIVAGSAGLSSALAYERPKAALTRGVARYKSTMPARLSLDVVELLDCSERVFEVGNRQHFDEARRLGAVTEHQYLGSGLARGGLKTSP
jgi:hypothetical protein